MHKTRLFIGGVLFVALIAGLGYAITTQRPIAHMQSVNTGEIPTVKTTNPTASSTATTATSTKPVAATNTPSDPNTYTSAQVSQHNSPSDCWASIEGNVYNLTTWINRHPGGPGAIQQLCGTDGTKMFQAEHRSSRAPRAALILLKIGTLK